MNNLQPVGRINFNFMATTGRLTVFTTIAVSHAIRLPFCPRIIVRQMSEIGNLSLPVVDLTAVCAGIILAVKSFTGFARFSVKGAIAADPEIIFFDKPITADVINDLIAQHVGEVGATAQSITHDVVSARKIADRIAMIYQGRIIWAGPTEETDTSGNEYADQFINGRAESPIEMALRV